MLRLSRGWAGLLLGLLLLSRAGPALAHPLHTTITELTHDAGTRRVRVVIRIFANDLAAAVAGPGRASADPGAMAGYVARHFLLRGADGKQIPLRWLGVKRTDDLLWIELGGEAPAGLRGGMLMNAMAFALFADQVNIVRARYGGSAHTLLFTRGARPQRLP